MRQESLFGPHALARKSNHDSSKLAARRVERSGQAQTQRRECYEAVVRWPGRSSRQLSQLSGISRYVMGRRLPELADTSKYVDGNAPIRRDAQRGMEIRWWVRRPL